MFQLNENEEKIFLRSQIVTLEKGRGKNRKYLLYVFTEQGIAMLSTVLKSDKAIHISIKIMRAFISMRKFLIQNSYLFQKKDHFEIKLLEHDKKIEH